MPDLKAYLRDCIDSFFNKTSNKAIMSESASPDYLTSTVITNNGAAAPYDGLCLMTYTVTSTGQYGAFMYVNQGSPMAVFGIRSSGYANDNQPMYIPVRKGDFVYGDFVNATFNKLTFVKTVGSSS